MSKIDPEHERQRLITFYAGQMDGELEKVAGQAYELTDLAREALRAELTKRGLTPKFVEQAPLIVKKESTPVPGDPPAPKPRMDQADSEDGDVEERKLVTVRQFRDLPEALLAKGCLDSANVDTFLVDDNVVRLDWFWSNMLGGVKLQVDAENAEAANEILSQPIPENFDVSGVGEFEQPHCPKCNSLDVKFQELAPSAYVSLAISVPYPFHRRAWRCQSCHAEWEDDGVDVNSNESPS
jgi:hypothetical protein